MGSKQTFAMLIGLKRQEHIDRQQQSNHVRSELEQALGIEQTLRQYQSEYNRTGAVKNSRLAISQDLRLRRQFANKLESAIDQQLKKVSRHREIYDEAIALSNAAAVRLKSIERLAKRGQAKDRERLSRLEQLETDEWAGMMSSRSR